MAALGDAIMASPALALLRAGLPGWRVSVLAKTQGVEYFRSLGSVDEVIPFVPSRYLDRARPYRLPLGAVAAWRVAVRLRAARFTASLQWRGQLLDTLLSRLTGAEHRVAGVQSIHRRAPIPVEKVPWLVTELVPYRDEPGHLVEALAAPVRGLLAKLGRPEATSALGPLEYPITAADRAQAGRFAAAVELGPDYACIGIGARTTYNAWPAERFATVGDEFFAAHGLRVLLTGAPEHRGFEDEVARRMRHPPIRSAGALGLGAVAALVEGARVVVALNTGLAHIAAACRRPVVVLSGRDGAAISPWRTPHRVVTRNPHYPARHPDRWAWGGLVGLIPTEDVVAAARSLLAESAPARPAS